MTDNTLSTGAAFVNQRIVRKVADRNDVDPLDLEPLYYTIEPEYIEGLVEDDSLASGDIQGKLAFSYSGCHVEVLADGSVEVSRINEKISDVSESDPASATTADPEAPD